MLEGIENRVVFIGMDQQRDELLYSSVKGKNPFKDKRVRQALYQAIDIEAIRNDDDARPVAADRRHAARAAAVDRRSSRSGCPSTARRRKKLLAEAGYPNGFEVTLDCPNNRYVNDEKICQALAAMWSQIGVATAVNAMPRATYFPKLEKHDTSLYMLGWGGAATDPIFILQPVLHGANGKGDGDYNYGRYTNAKLDALTSTRSRPRSMSQKRRRLDQRGADDRARRVLQPAAAPPGDSLGDARQRHRGAPRRQQRHPVLGDDAVAARVGRCAHRRRVRRVYAAASGAARRVRASR